MTTSQRPTEYFNGINYNSQFYNTPQYVTLEYATQNFLNRVGVANSMCSSTTFENTLIGNGGFSTTNIGCSSINNTGDYTGSYLSLNNSIISAGYQAGQINQGLNAVAIGYQAGQNNQGQYSVGIGFGACLLYQGQFSVGIGYQSGKDLQGNNSVAIGNKAGHTGQGQYSIALGNQAGYINQGEYSLCIGSNSMCNYDYSCAIGANSVSNSNHNISIGTIDETINLNGDTTCQSLVSLSTQDADINNTGSIVTYGGINLAKNIYGQNFQTNNDSNVNGIISKTNRGSNIIISSLVVDYLTYNLSGDVSGNRFYSMSCNSGFGGVINIMTPLLLRIISSVGRTGTTATSYTFSVSVTNINLVINKNGSYYSTIPMSNTVNNTTFDFSYTGTTNGIQTIDVYAYLTPVYTQFTLIPDTLNTTDNYDFYVTANIAYTSNVNVPYSSGTNTFFLYANDTYNGLILSRVGCSLSSTPNTSGNTVSPELYCDTVCPLSFGTSYTNILNCNNIKMPLSGIISKETVNSHDISTYHSYLTVRDCGVYLYNSSSTAILISFPIYYSIIQYSNFFTSALTGGNLNSYNVANDGTAGIGQYGGVNCANNDDAYLIYPDHGIKVYTGANFGGTLVIDYYNSTTTLNTVRAVTNNTGNSCKLYYKGVEITSY